MNAIFYVAVGAGLLLLAYSVMVLRRRSKGTDDPVRRHENFLQRGEGDASARQAKGRRDWGGQP